MLIPEIIKIVDINNLCGLRCSAELNWESPHSQTEATHGLNFRNIY
jgi:hypothetical protein